MVGSTMLTCVARQEAGVDPSPSHHDPNLDPLDVADDDHDFSDSDCEEAHALRFHGNAPFQNRHVDDFAKSAMNWAEDTHSDNDIFGTQRPITHEQQGAAQRQRLSSHGWVAEEEETT